jgi:nitroreductase/NAD-dependent dihydropyrimidine dehydrogenase PreA subunit
MSLLTVDRSRCVQCGLCVSVCPRGLIRFEDGWPNLTTPRLCIACGHCVAVCPASALDNERAPLAGQLPLPDLHRLEPESALFFLRSRRSVRCFDAKPVSRDLLRRLLEVARFAPSGGNSQGISYQVIDSRPRLRQLTTSTVAWMEEPAQAFSSKAPVYAQYVKMYRQGGCDSILRDAPTLILGTAAKAFARGRENTLLALEYAELYAPTLGLGTCWAGLLEDAAFAGYPPLLEALRLPGEKQLTGALMAGFPKIGFQRLVNRQPLDISFLEA